MILDLLHPLLSSSIVLSWHLYTDAYGGLHRTWTNHFTLSSLSLSFMYVCYSVPLPDLIISDFVQSKIHHPHFSDKIHVAWTFQNIAALVMVLKQICQIAEGRVLWLKPRIHTHP